MTIYLPSSPPNKVSTLNSTTQWLTGLGSFTGTWEDVTAYDSVVVAVKTDQNGSFVIQFSPDGTNIDSSLTRYYRTGQIEAPHRFTITRKYVRIVYTNDTDQDQDILRLQTTFGYKTPLNAPMDGTLSQDFDAQVVRPTSYAQEVVLGRRQGSIAWSKFGYNDDVDTSVSEVIAAFGGAFVPIVTASTLTVVSSSTADDNTTPGTGAQGIVIYGIDATRTAQTEVVYLNGTSSVTTATTWLGINRVSVFLAGSGLANAGTITITATTGGATWATVPIGVGSTQQVIFHTQDNHSALVETIVYKANKIGGSGALITFKVWVFSAVSNCKYEVARYIMDTGVENNYTQQLTIPLLVAEKSTVWMEAISSAVNAKCSGWMSIIETRDPAAI